MHTSGAGTMDKATLEEFVVRILPTVEQVLNIRFRRGRAFGEEHGDELAQEVVTWLMSGGRVHEGILDARTLTVFLCDKARKWAYDRWLARSGQRSGTPPRRGGSAVVIESEEGTRLGDFDALPANVKLGSTPEDEPEMQLMLQDALDAAISDLNRWARTSKRGSKVLEERVRGLSRRELGEHFGVAPPRISDDLKKAEFCLLRRLGYPNDTLISFADDAHVWLEELDQIDRTSNDRR